MARNAVLVFTSLFFVLLMAGSGLAAGLKKIDQGKAAGIATENLHSAKSFIGTEVRDSAGKKVGEVKDLAIDFNRGTGYAVVSSDETLKIDKTFLVPLNALTSTHDGEYVNLTVSREQLTTIPRRDPGMTDQEYDRSLYDFYGLSYPWDDLPGDVPLERSTIPGRNLNYPGQREVVPSDNAPGNIERVR